MIQQMVRMVRLQGLPPPKQIQQISEKEAPDASWVLRERQGEGQGGLWPCTPTKQVCKHWQVSVSGFRSFGTCCYQLIIRI